MAKTIHMKGNYDENKQLIETLFLDYLHKRYWDWTNLKINMKIIIYDKTSCKDEPNLSI